MVLCTGSQVGVLSLLFRHWGLVEILIADYISFRNVFIGLGVVGVGGVGVAGLDQVVLLHHGERGPPQLGDERVALLLRLLDGFGQPCSLLLAEVVFDHERVESVVEAIEGASASYLLRDIGLVPPFNDLGLADAAEVLVALGAVAGGDLTLGLFLLL